MDLDKNYGYKLFTDAFNINVTHREAAFTELGKCGSIGIKGVGPTVTLDDNVSVVLQFLQVFQRRSTN